VVIKTSLYYDARSEKHQKLGFNWYVCQDITGIEGNEKADQPARQGSSCPLLEHEPHLGISAKVARGVISRWMNKKHKEYCQSIHGQKQAKDRLLKLLENYSDQDETSYEQ
jgi:hypothetical protein